MGQGFRAHGSWFGTIFCIFRSNVAEPLYSCVNVSSLKVARIAAGNGPRASPRRIHIQWTQVRVGASRPVRDTSLGPVHVWANI